MAGPSVRIVDALKQEAAAYAAGLGLSLSGLVAVALREYLDARRTHPATERSVSEGREPVAAAMVVPKVGRNQPCPCGSGKVYRHCHGDG